VTGPVADLATGAFGIEAGDGAARVHRPCQSHANVAASADDAPQISYFKNCAARSNQLPLVMQDALIGTAKTNAQVNSTAP